MLFSKLFCLFLKVSGPQSFPPPLPKEEEIKYFRLAAEGDKEARGKLIEHNLRLVAHIVKKYYSTCKNQDDLVSIGTVGLIKSIDSFKTENGARFATYASKCIQNEILMYFRAQKKIGCEVSINETIDIDKDGNPLTYIDVISCDDTIAEDLDFRIKSKKAFDLIRSVLTERERKIIIMRFGLNNQRPIPQREIASQLGISRSYVSRIEKSAIEKLRAEFGLSEQ